MKLPIPTGYEPEFTALPNGERILVCRLPVIPPTAEEHADALESGQSQIVRSGARGRVTGICKARRIHTHHRRLDNGNYLFEPCAKRAFKEVLI